MTPATPVGGHVATATASLTLAVVSAVTVTSGGDGYTSAPTVTFTGGEGVGAAATATITGNYVSAVAVTDGGAGYTSAPTVVFSGGRGKLTDQMIEKGD